MICEVCGKAKAIEMHHNFPQNKRNKHYYKELIYNLTNITFICKNCHINHAPKWSEIEFCYAMNIEPRSKEGKEIWERIRQ